MDQPSEDDVRAQAEMNLPWRLEYSWEDLIRVWRNTRTGEVIGPSLDSRVTPMTAKVGLEAYKGGGRNGVLRRRGGGGEK